MRPVRQAIHDLGMSLAEVPSIGESIVTSRLMRFAGEPVQKSEEPAVLLNELNSD
jgi:hypothetical protein